MANNKPHRVVVGIKKIKEINIPMLILQKEWKRSHDHAAIAAAAKLKQLTSIYGLLFKGGS